MVVTINNIASNFRRHNFVSIAAGLLLLVLAPTVSAQLPLECGSLQNGYGPYDYTNATHRRDNLPRVETHHFDAGVQSLQGHARKLITDTGSDLDYTLRAFPNHHGALYATIRYVLSEDPRHRKKMRYSVDCYLKRAMVMQPNDGKVRLLYGIYLSRTNRVEEAKTEFQEAARLMPDSAEVHYNIGLMLAKSGDYEDARAHAHKAYALGYPLPGLRNILKRAGQWDSPSS